MVDKLVNSEINKKRIANVEYCFGMSGVPLGVPGRVLVGEGILTKICRKKPKSRQFFLFNDILVYGTILINKKKYAQQHIIPLEGLVVEDLPDESVMKNGWLIKTSSKSFAVYAGSPSEKAEWIRHIKKCANDLLEQTGRTAPSEHAAVWIPDSIARICMHCKRTQFTMINRRHHCRACGSVICGNCSKNRVVILHQSKSPVRVCDTCNENFHNYLKSQSKKLSIHSTTKSSAKQQILDDAAEIKTCIDDAMNNRVKEWLSRSGEQCKEPESKEDEIEKKNSENVSIKETEEPETKVNDEKSVVEPKVEEQVNEDKVAESYQNVQTSDSEEDQNDLSNSVEDILDESLGKPTFYDLQLSRELTNDEWKNDSKSENDLLNGESTDDVEKVDKEFVSEGECVQKLKSVQLSDKPSSVHNDEIKGETGSCESKNKNEIINPDLTKDDEKQCEGEQNKTDDKTAL